MNPSPLHRTIAAVLVALLFAAVPATHARILDASLSGRVFAADGFTPRAGVTVRLVQGQGEAESVFSSTVTPADGSFAIDGAPAGDYALLVETEHGAYLLPKPLALQPGANPPLALTLNAAGEETGLGSETAGEMAGWVKWLVVGVLGAVGLYVIYEVTDSEDPSSSF